MSLITDVELCYSDSEYKSLATTQRIVSHEQIGKGFLSIGASDRRGDHSHHCNNRDSQYVDFDEGHKGNGGGQLAESPKCRAAVVSLFIWRQLRQHFAIGRFERTGFPLQRDAERL